MTDSPYENVDSPEKLAAAILALRETIFSAPDQWESGSIEQYLECTAAMLSDNAAAGNFNGVPASNWQTVIDVLRAGSSYE